jgi:hypothetical protein
MKKISICVLSILFISILLSGCLEEESETTLDYSSLQTNGLIGFWMFNEEDSWHQNETTIIDLSAFSNNGIAYGSIQENRGINEGPCAFFDGTDDYILINNSPSLEPEQLTVELWAKATQQNGSFSYLLSKGSSYCDWSSYAMYTDTNGGICFYIHGVDQVVKSPNPGPSIWDGQWHHIVGTYDHETIRLYIDGQEYQQGTDGNVNISYNLTTGNNLIIGNYIGSCTLPFSGYIDNVLIWNRALTDDEVYQHYLFGSQHTTPTLEDIDTVSFETAKSRIKTYLEPYTVNNILIIKGSQLSIQDNLILSMVASQIENADEIKKVTDNQTNDILLENYDLLILLGSKKSNTYTYELQSTNNYIETSSFKSIPFIIHFGIDNQQDKNVLIAYLESEANNQQNYGAEKSPLNGLIDKKIIPIVATSISIILIYIWSVIGNTVTEFIFDFISEHIAERKMKKIKKSTLKLEEKQYANMLWKETLTTILAIIIFSVAMSWTWSADMTEFQQLFLLNIFIISIVFILRESIRIHLSKKYEMQTRHVFWPFGALLTLGSTILGNTFSLASFTMLDNDEQQKQFGKMYYFIFKLFYGLSLIFFIINFFFPAVYLQMSFVFLMMSIVIDMTPIEPMDGHDVRFWNKRKWLGFYIIVIISYIFMNFSITLQII